MIERYFVNARFVFPRFHLGRPFRALFYKIFRGKKKSLRYNLKLVTQYLIDQRDETEENESNDDEDLMLQTNSASYWKRETKCHEFYRGREFLLTALNHGLERNKKKPAIA